MRFDWPMINKILWANVASDFHFEYFDDMVLASRFLVFFSIYEFHLRPLPALMIIYILLTFSICLAFRHGEARLC